MSSAWHSQAPPASPPLVPSLIWLLRAGWVGTRPPRYCRCWPSISLGHVQAFRIWKLEGLRYQIKLPPVETRGSVHLGRGLGPGHYTPRPINGELDWPWQGPGMPGCWPTFRFQLAPCLESLLLHSVGRVLDETCLRAGSPGVGHGWP